VNCIFCKIINKELEAKIYYEDAHCLAINDIHPKAPVHLLIIPKQHIATLNDLKGDETLLAGRLIQVAKQMATKMEIAQPGYQLVINCNEGGGQVIYHLHLHLLGGKRLHLAG